MQGVWRLAASAMLGVWLFAGMPTMAFAAGQTLTADFDMTSDVTLDAPYVGTATLTYGAGTPLPDGAYKLSGLVTPSLTISFPDAPQTFTLADLTAPASSDLWIIVRGSQFSFATVGSTPDVPQFTDKSGKMLWFETVDLSEGSAAHYYAQYTVMQPGYSVWFGGSYGVDLQRGAAASAPTVITTAASSVTVASAISGGNVTADGGASVTARGVCWSTSVNPTTSDFKTTDGSGAGAFTSSITGLSANTTYHARAYATNSEGTSYGSDVQFTTSAPSVTSTPASSDWSIALLVVSGVGLLAVLKRRASFARVP